MADPDVVRILRDRYRLTVTFKPLGSYAQVRLTNDEIRARGAECLWPSSASAQNVYEALHTQRPADYRAETVLQSPEVIYAGPDGVAALLGAGVVAERNGRYFLTDMKSLLLDYVLRHKTWESLGTSTIRGPITVGSTDPALSNSGFTLAQLELTILATEDVFSAPSKKQADKALGTMRAIYDAQGLQASSSDAGFRQWLIQGAELHAPLYAGYENQLIQQVTQEPNSAQVIDNVRLIYPDPTIYNDHPILALSPTAGRFLDAMKDTEIQTIAWRKYGFRSGTDAGLSDVADFADLPLAQQIRTTAPPSAAVTLALLDCLADADKCHGGTR